MKFMDIAIEEAKKGIEKRDGGPFGAVIVKDGKVIATGHNEVICSHDPTAHAEMVAIRKASKVLERFDLSDCELYTTCEPCPMCFGAIHWAKIKKVYYGATRHDAKEIGFDDEYIYEVLSNKIKDKNLSMENAERDNCLEIFKVLRKMRKKSFIRGDDYEFESYTQNFRYNR